MAFKSNRSNGNQLRNRYTTSMDGIKNLRAIGNLSTLNPDYRSYPVPLSTNYLPSSPMYSASISAGQSVPPPLPPRPAQTTGYSRYSRYAGLGGYYSPFPSGLYSQPFGYRAPYSRYGAVPYDSASSFVQMAEESSRPAFESIESVVEVVSSISMMLESTYHAVHSSYSAVLGVVDQFSRLKDHLAQVLSFLALLRGLRWLCLKILYLLRLRKDNPSVETAWKSAKQAVGSYSPDFDDDGRSPWPFFVFISLVIGAPWLMFKLLTKNMDKKPFDLSHWKGQLYVADALYNFEATRHGELSFVAGEKLYLAPNNLQHNVPRGWLLACNKKKQSGLVPSNYLQRSSLANVAPSAKFSTDADIPRDLEEVSGMGVPARQDSARDENSVPVSDSENNSGTKIVHEDVELGTLNDKCNKENKE